MARGPMNPTERHDRTMNENVLDELFARPDTAATRAAPPLDPPRHPNATGFIPPADRIDSADISAQPDAPDAPTAALAEALIAGGALDAHVERIVRHVLAEYDTQQNVYARRAGGYRPGAFGSIG